MIIQRSLKIHNGCQHEDLNVDFVSGVTYAVTGKNACGKTNMLQLNMYGLLGIVNKSWGSQKDFNRAGTKDGYVEVCIENTEKHNLMHIRRHFTAGTKNPDRLWYNDINHDPDVIGRDAINDVLQNEYGVSCKILFELLYMRQGMSSWLLTAPSTSIYTFMNSIFDTSKFKRIREVLMDAANSIALYEVDHSRITFLTTQIEQLSAIEYADTSDMVNQLNKCREQLASVSADNTLTPAEYNTKMNDLSSRHSNACTVLIDLEESLKRVDTNPVPWLTDEHRDFARQYNDVDNRRSQLMTEITMETSGLNAKQGNINKINGLIEDICKHIKEVDSYIDKFMSVDKCPFCEGRIKSKSLFRSNIEKLYAGNSYEDFKRRRAVLDAELDTLVSKCKEHESTIVTLEDTLTTLSKFITDNIEVYNTINDAIGTISLWEHSKVNRNHILSSIESAKANINTIAEQMVELSKAGCMSEDNAKTLDELKRSLNRDIAYYEGRISAINTEKVANTTKINSYKSELESRNKDMDKNKKNQSMFDRIMRLREGTSNKRIPARYLNDKVDKLNGELESYCRMAGLEVILFLDKDDFVFRFTDGKDVRPTGQLSGAQQTLCSTILQLALVRVVNPRLGVIQMDEPTVFLDPVNRAKLLTLFESLASVLSSSGTITLVPTHDVDLIGACNERIEL